MPSYYLWTVGCQMNVSDSERLGAALEQVGYTASAQPKDSDVVVLNTCSVRAGAEDKAINQLHLLKSMKTENPDITIALVGCMVPKDASSLQKQFPFVDIFCRPQQFTPLLDLAAEKIGTSNGCLDRFPLPNATGPTAFVPISSGCNKVCSFCIIPYRRGTEQSRSLESIVEEVTILASRGVREVTLLGQNVDSYGYDFKNGTDLAMLLEYLNEVPHLERIRFLTSHPADMTDRLIDAVARLDKVCEHINLPVQSGDDGILKSMRRGYGREDYRALVNKIRDRIPGVSMATDIIVGYPGESDEAFQNTFNLLADLQLDVVHVAMYSPRPGTLANRYGDDVTPDDKRARLQRIEELQKGISAEYNARYQDATVDVLIERKQKDRWVGRTRTNKLVFVDAGRDLTGQTISVQIDRVGPWSLSGSMPGVSRTFLPVLSVPG